MYAEQNLGTFRHTWINYIAGSQGVSVEDYLNETGATQDSVQLVRLSLAQVEAIVGDDDDKVSEGLKDLASIPGAFVAEAYYPAIGGGVRHVLVGFVETKMPMSDLFSCGSGLLESVLDDTEYDSTCNACGCGNPPPPVLSCVNRSGENTTARTGCGCAVSRSRACECTDAGGCAPCESGSGVYDPIDLTDLLGNYGFWTDPDDAATYLFNEQDLETLWYGALI